MGFMDNFTSDSLVTVKQPDYYAMRYTEHTDRRATEKRSCILRKGWGKVESFT